MKAGERDPIWDALVKAFGYTPATKSERGKWNKAAKELRDAGVDPSLIGPRLAKYRRTWPGINANPLALAAHWGELGERTSDFSDAHIRVFARARREWESREVVDDAIRAFGYVVPHDRVERVVLAELASARSVIMPPMNDTGRT